MSKTIPEQLKTDLEQQLAHFLSLADQAFEQTYSLPELKYNVRGKVAGKAYLQAWEIRLNPKLLIENQREFIEQVIPHELAHLITYQQFGRVRPHGKEWQYVMERVFNKPASTYHKFDVTSVQGQTFPYQCNCRQHHLSIRRHNKVQRKQSLYHCVDCKSLLVFIVDK